MGYFWEKRPTQGAWGWPSRRKSLADKILETPSVLLGNLADALVSLPPVSLLESRARKAARQARRDARSAAAHAGRRFERRADQARAAAVDVAQISDVEARRLRRRVAERAADARQAAGETMQDIADELDRLGGKAARLSAAAEQELRPRRRGLFARLFRAPTAGERVAESAERARRAGSDWISDVAAPLLSLWLTTSGRAAGQAADWSADQARKAADVALDREPRGMFSWLFPPKARRVERIKAQAAAARAESAARLDDMKAKLEEMRARAMAIGDGEAVQKARDALDRLSRLRLTITEEPPPPTIFQALAQAIGARPESPAPKVRASASLWPFGDREPARWNFGASQGGGSTLGYAVTAAAAVAAYALVQTLAKAPKGSGFADKEDDAASPFAVAARSAQPGRGRTASSPTQIPWAGWKDIFWRTFKEIGEDRLLAISAGVVFYGLLALFPAITAVVSSYGLFAAPATIGEHLGFLQSMLPPGAYSIVQDQIQRVVSAGDVKLGLSFVVGLALAIWSANAGMKAVIDALNIVYDEREKRGFFKLNAVSLAFTVSSVVAVLVGIGAIVVVPVVVNAIGFGQGEEIAAMVNVLRWPALVVLLLIGLAALYRYGPSRREAQWRWLSVGAIAATVLWIGGSVALSYYISRFGDYDKTYGSLGAAIGMMMWMWLSTIVILFGAELNSEIEHQTALDSTVGASKPIGARGATMADSVGEASE